MGGASQQMGGASQQMSQQQPQTVQGVQQPQQPQQPQQQARPMVVWSGIMELTEVVSFLLLKFQKFSTSNYSTPFTE